MSSITRSQVVEGMTGTLLGRGWTPAPGLRFLPGPTRSFALEVNVPEGEETLERAARFAFELGLRMMPTADAALGLASGDSGSVIMDLADERFWQLHATGATGWLEPTLQARISRSTDVDWCWLPQSDIAAMQRHGQTRWFKSDFRGDEMLAERGVKARRLKVQLEGDDADELRRHIASLAGYGEATALTGVAIEVREARAGRAHEAAHYRGGFKASGDSFEVHQAFVSAAIQRYGDRVRRVENEFGLRWRVGDGDAIGLDGHVIEIALERPIEDLDRFASVLFSCREPFRLWAVPTREGPGCIEAEVVDLHIGQQFEMDIQARSIRLYLANGVCANTVFRLLANLQHRFDAKASLRAQGLSVA